MDYPFGYCECSTGHDQCKGPALIQVTRAGETLKVCSRCTISGDADRKCLATKETPVGVFADYDPFAPFIVVEMLEGEKS